MGRFDERTVRYEPTSVKDLLVEMKDTAELLIDLSYSAVLHASLTVAHEVVELEHRMDVLQMRARMSLMLAARNPNEAETLAPVLGVIAAADKVADAAGDIAKIVTEEIGLPEAMRGALSAGVETLVRGTVRGESAYAGRTLDDIDLESETGVRVIAVRRDEDWILNPGPTTRLAPGDVTLLRGPEAGVEDVYPELSGDPFEPEPAPEPAIDDLERAVDSIVLMKNLSELAVDLAYGSVLFDNEELAEEVSNLEIEVDALQSRFEAWTLRAAAEADDPVSLRGLIHLGVATEEISDAALAITEGVLRDLDVHPVVEMAVQESDEIITRTVVVEGSELDGTAVADGVPATDISTSILAIRRPDEGWLVGHDIDTTLRGGDVIISKGTRTSAEEFDALAA
ncbi:TrkA C-terminal domain-containing protein [Halorubrum ezzemoulense]|uniref:TrkA C-terminal domain-containing protein n=1 Tax=Halorubrum ezzemoulense TaxID=337243 RepID=A0ABT4YYN1_HALEZ|nr:TrkA C-terminal domain-containing protein [Halorubrum ezzemoulense]MDB2245429.1 TrkA C-terminal domain-containing protein [Halorubrum ezzemoulense]MDB2250315.1 TrkA C-terminal domain-containing protein [Halorubrum ezzemoulense]MDB2279193.1 TrkA C-terminal domain-containing protein [Halorubrum ezzemoulense]MDB2285571.1 TrkA C-terminal domain-containing protein [Halorubrum ezzemoulense]MDB2287385.1 TrkA C-terminal domain-containing protein [Halorubrum ezzemoulense]